MKRFVAVALTAMVAASLVGQPATAAKKKKKGYTQSVEGSIALPIKHVNYETQEISCYSGVHRRGNMATEGNDHNGVVGFSFDVDKRTVGKAFALSVGGEQDLDITFYNEFGTRDQLADPGYAPGLAENFQERGAGGEAGIIPVGTTKAIVCMFEGTQSTFTYKAGAGVKAPKK